MSEKNQEKSPSASKSSAPADCPFARNGIVSSLHKLTEEDGLLATAVKEQLAGNALAQESNELAKKNSKMMRLVVIMFFISALIFLMVGILAWVIFGDVRLVEKNIERTVTKQDQVIIEIRALVKGQKKTGKKLDDAKEALESKPTVELVPEDDPEKAKDAPLKVRIVPPKSATKTIKSGGGKVAPPDPTATAVEVPLPLKEAKKVQDAEVK